MAQHTIDWSKVEEVPQRYNKLPELLGAEVLVWVDVSLTTAAQGFQYCDHRGWPVFYSRAGLLTTAAQGFQYCDGDHCPGVVLALLPHNSHAGLQVLRQRAAAVAHGESWQSEQHQDQLLSYQTIEI